MTDALLWPASPKTHAQRRRDVRRRKVIVPALLVLAGVAFVIYAGRFVLL